MYIFVGKHMHYLEEFQPPSRCVLYMTPQSKKRHWALFFCHPLDYVVLPQWCLFSFSSIAAHWIVIFWRSFLFRVKGRYVHFAGKKNVFSFLQMGKDECARYGLQFKNKRSLLFAVQICAIFLRKEVSLRIHIVIKILKILRKTHQISRKNVVYL